jgi:hypothetical protein
MNQSIVLHKNHTRSNDNQVAKYTTPSVFFSKGITKGISTGDLINKRCTSGFKTISSTAGGGILLGQLLSSDVNTYTEFASMAARYQLYRVKKLRATFLPRYNTFYAAVTEPQGVFCISDTKLGILPSNSNQVLADEGAVVMPQGKEFSYEASWTSNPNAKLWTTTNSTILVSNTYGMNFISAQSDFIPVSSVVYDYYVEAQVEFMSAQ